MAWVRLDDTFTEHPKLLAVGGDAGWLHVCAIAYCSRNLTDGFVPSGALRQLSDRRSPIKLAVALVDAGLWERTERGFVIHDYLDYHPTRAEVEADRAVKSARKAAAGHLGGIASGVARRKHERSKHEANDQANTNENEAPTRPDPTPTTLTTQTTPPLVPGVEGGVDNLRRTEAIRLYAIEAVRRGNPRSASAYMAKAQRTVAADPELDRLLDLFPDAPADAVACWLHGEKGSMAYYRRADELDPGNVFHIGGATA